MRPTIALFIMVTVLTAQHVLAQSIRYKGHDGEDNGRPGQASLDIDTPDCPTTFGPPICEKQTSWTLDKTTGTGPLQDPNNAPFFFSVKVTEGTTTEILSGTGQIVITNSGELSAVLSSILR